MQWMSSSQANMHHTELSVSAVPYISRGFHGTHPTLSRYSQNSICVGSEHSLIKYAFRNIFRCRICGLSSLSAASMGPSKLVLLVWNARAVISYCKSFLYTILTTAGIRALMYLAPETRASTSPWFWISFEYTSGAKQGGNTYYYWSQENCASIGSELQDLCEALLERCAA